MAGRQPAIVGSNAVVGCAMRELLFFATWLVILVIGCMPLIIPATLFLGSCDAHGWLAPCWAGHCIAAVPFVAILVFLAATGRM
jgi:hypothetical protein